MYAGAGTFRLIQTVKFPVNVHKIFEVWKLSRYLSFRAPEAQAAYQIRPKKNTAGAGISRFVVDQTAKLLNPQVLADTVWSAQRGNQISSSLPCFLFIFFNLSAFLRNLLKVYGLF